MKPALSGLGGQRRKVCVIRQGSNLARLKLQPLRPASPLLVLGGPSSPPPSSWLEGKLSPASRPKRGPWSSQQKPPTPPPSLSSPPPAPRKEACRLGWAPQHPGELSFSSPGVPSLAISLSKGPERGGGFPWELLARKGIRSVRPRVTKHPRPRGNHSAALRTLRGAQGRGPCLQGREGSSSWKKGQKRRRPRAPGWGHGCDRRRRLTATSAQGLGGAASLQPQLPTCFLETEPLDPEDLNHRPLRPPCRTRSCHPQPLWAPEMVQQGCPKMNRNLHPPTRNGCQAGTGTSLRATPVPGHRGNTVQSRGWTPGASQNPGSSSLSSAAPSGSGGPKRPPSGAQPALRAGSEHPPGCPECLRGPSVCPAAA